MISIHQNEKFVLLSSFVIGPIPDFSKNVMLQDLDLSVQVQAIYDYEAEARKYVGGLTGKVNLDFQPSIQNYQFIFIRYSS